MNAEVSAEIWRDMYIDLLQSRLSISGEEAVKMAEEEFALYLEDFRDEERT